MGEEIYPEAGHLLICADGGGSNGYRVRLWKVELQAFADESGLEVTVCHLPPGTSKWNKIEHRLFSHITMNWRGRPLVSHQVVVELIAATRTATGLEVEARLDTRTLSDEGQGDEGAVGASPAGAAQVPRRMELHHQAEDGGTNGQVVALISFQAPTRQSRNQIG